MSEAVTGGEATAQPRRRSRNWVWFFIVLAVLTTTAIALEISFNLSQQLKPEGCAAARRLWDQNGPTDYILEYTVREKGQGPERSERYVVTVVGGKAESATTETGRRLKADDYPFENVEALFKRLEQWLEMKHQPGGSGAYVAATFNAAAGYPIHMVRSDWGSRERVEVTKVTVTARP
jgi:hypothetical protein